MIDFKNLPDNLTIFDSFAKAHSVLRQYSDIMCSVSGGSDSDIVIDLISKIDDEKRVRYVWFDTGLEFAATKEHLAYLEQKYGITIEREKAVKSIPYSARNHGQPFLSKYVSENMARLQRHGFQWEDEPFEVLYEHYPKCKSALMWWCSNRNETTSMSHSKFSISRNKWLKEFIIENPPTFQIGAVCCKYAKKDVAKNYKKQNDIQLSITGVRRAEGGIRSAAYKNCWSVNDKSCDEYRPLFWYSNEDKKAYENFFGIEHSRCYTEYGMTRTGCAGCPYSQSLEQEVNIIDEYEPKLSKAVRKVFADSYEYTRQYREFAKMMNDASR